LLSTKNKADRITKSKALLARLGNGTHLNVLWTDEKIFTTEQALNKQNDRILASSVAAASGRIVQRAAHPASVMVWGGITSRAKTPLVFVEMGAKVNQVYYREKITVVKPWFQRNFLDQEGIFQQDGAPAHTAKKTQQWFRDNSINFIPKEEWPANSPDLNPMDFSIWGYLEEKACVSPHKNLESLKQSLV
jgi:hypothetical protein